MGYRVRLRSDFLDYYDHHFDRDGIMYWRLANGGITRAAALKLLKLCNFPVPRWSMRVPDGIKPEAMVVVHHDQNAHRGDGKELVAARNAPPNTLVEEYIDGSYGESTRYLQIGDKSFWLSYKSKDDWRSNVGDVDITLIREADNEHKHISVLPLFAIDFVTAKDRTQYAIDFNSAPGIGGTPIEALLKPAQVVALIKAWLERRYVKMQNQGLSPQELD